jgi:hypothetical protein
MIDIRIGVREAPATLTGIRRIVVKHVLMDLFLEIDPYGTIRTNDFVAAYAGVTGHVAAGIRDTQVGTIVSDGMIRSLDRGQFLQKFLTRNGSRWRRL